MKVWQWLIVAFLLAVAVGGLALVYMESREPEPTRIEVDLGGHRLDATVK